MTVWMELSGGVQLNVNFPQLSIQEEWERMDMSILRKNGYF